MKQYFHIGDLRLSFPRGLTGAAKKAQQFAIAAKRTLAVA